MNPHRAVQKLLPVLHRPPPQRLAGEPGAEGDRQRAGLEIPVGGEGDARTAAGLLDDPLADLHRLAQPEGARMEMEVAAGGPAHLLDDLAGGERRPRAEVERLA